MQQRRAKLSKGHHRRLSISEDSSTTILRWLFLRKPWPTVDGNAPHLLHFPITMPSQDLGLRPFQPSCVMTPENQFSYKRRPLNIWPVPIPARESSRQKQSLGQPGTPNPNASAGTACGHLASPDRQRRTHRQIPAHTYCSLCFLTEGQRPGSKFWSWLPGHLPGLCLHSFPP